MIDLADDHYDLEIHKAQRLLDWEPAHTLKATLPKMIHHLKADPKKWFQEHEL
jgi:nucleoside-diphosphate-sugar epimerase